MKPNYHIRHSSHIEKPKKEFTYSIAIAFGVVTELALIAVQFIFLTINSYLNPGSSISFSSKYMLSQGFFIFLITGIILYGIIVYQIVRRYSISSLAYMLVFLVAGGLIELAFYLSIQAAFQGAFFYSILDKVIGAFMGALVYFTMGKRSEFSS